MKLLERHIQEFKERRAREKALAAKRAKKKRLVYNRLRRRREAAALREPSLNEILKIVRHSMKRWEEAEE